METIHKLIPYFLISPRFWKYYQRAPLKPQTSSSPQKNVREFFFFLKCKKDFKKMEKIYVILSSVCSSLYSALLLISYVINLLEIASGRLLREHLQNQNSTCNLYRILQICSRLALTAHTVFVEIIILKNRLPEKVKLHHFLIETIVWCGHHETFFCNNGTIM